MMQHLPWTFNENDFHIRDSEGNINAIVSLDYPVAEFADLKEIGRLLARAPELLDDDAYDWTDPAQNPWLLTSPVRK